MTSLYVMLNIVSSGSNINIFLPGMESAAVKSISACDLKARTMKKRHT